MLRPLQRQVGKVPTPGTFIDSGAGMMEVDERANPADVDFHDPGRSAPALIHETGRLFTGRFARHRRFRKINLDGPAGLRDKRREWIPATSAKRGGV
jgi:hypothetical protein